MTTATTVMMVRHASHGHLGRTLTGRMPGVVLSETGRNEARRLAGSFRCVAAAAVFASPLERARETADAIGEAMGLPVATCEALNEIDLGEWTGASFEDLASDERWHGWNRERADGCPPGGEPIRAVQARTMTQVEAWRDAYPDGTIVAVSHADVIKALVCHVLGLSLDRMQSFEVEPASVTTVVAWAGGAKVVRLNAKAAA